MEPLPVALKGKLVVDILQAKGLPACDKPYCVATVIQRDDKGKRTKTAAKTSVRKVKGKKGTREDPEWEERLVFTLSNPSSLCIVVKDSDLLHDEVVAQGEMSFAELDLLGGAESLGASSGTTSPGAGIAAAEGDSKGKAAAILAEGGSGETKAISLSLAPLGELRLLVTFEDLNCLFGLDLTSVCARERVAVPLIITKCCEAIEVHGIRKEGIYRVPGSKQVVDEFRRRFIEDSSAVELGDLALGDVNNIASLFKQYLRELPEPLLTTALYNQFAAASALPDPENKRQAFISLLLQLPPAHFSTVVYVFTHLHRVAERQSDNKMTAVNLATCFSMSMLGTPPSEISHMDMTPSKTGGVGPSVVTAEFLRTNTASGNEIVRFLIAETDIIGTAAARRKEEAKHTDLSDEEGAGTPRGRAKRSPKARGLFQKYDLDASGRIDFEGFRALCHDMGLYIAPTDRKEFDALEGAVDSGRISWPTFKRWWDKRGRDLEVSADRQKTLHQAVRYFRYFDKTKTGFLTKESFQELHADLLRNGFVITPDAEACMRELDRDTDGRISFSEFTRWLLATGGASPS